MFGNDKGIQLSKEKAMPEWQMQENQWMKVNKIEIKLQFPLYCTSTAADTHLQHHSA